MQSVQHKKETKDNEVQTRIYIRSDRPDKPVKVLRNCGIQTIITTEPDQSIQTIRALLQFIPQGVIDKGGIKEIQLPRAALLQWKLPLVAYELVKREQERHHRELRIKSKHEITQNSTKSALKKRESDSNLGEWAALLALSHPHIMEDERLEKETQTNFTVRPHVLGDEQIAQLAKASSLQTSLTFDPDASITDIQPELTKDIDHFHEYITIIIPKQYIGVIEHDDERNVKEAVVEEIIVPRKDRFKINENKEGTNASCQCPSNILPTQIDANTEERNETPVNINTNSALTNTKTQQQDEFNNQQATFDQFLEMLMSDLADKSIPHDIKDVLLQELAEFAANPFKLENPNTANTKENVDQKKGTDAVFPNQADDEAFEKVVTQIMNSCVYNIEDQLKRIVDTFDTYQKDLKNMTKQLDNIQTDASNIENKQSVRPNSQRETSLEIPQASQGHGQNVALPPMEMQGDFHGRLKHEVEVVCECCQLTAGGAASPTLGNPPLTFDVVVGPDGIELQNNTKSLSTTGEQVIRFSIIPSQPRVNQNATSKSLHQNIFEIHVSRPNVPGKNVPSDMHGKNLGTGSEYECTVVLPPKRMMRTSEDNLAINGTSQKIGLMFEQDCDYVEPYIINVEDTTVPVNMLYSNKSRYRKKILKAIEPQDTPECTTTTEIPWELITLQVSVEDDEEKAGCCIDYIEPTCTRTFCPMAKVRSKDFESYIVDFEEKDDVTFIVDDDDDLDYEPAVTRKSIITASTSEIHDSMSDIFIEEAEKHLIDLRSKKLPPFVYDPKAERHNEPYMDDMYNHFPDDFMDGNCGSHTEIPWNIIEVPTNAKIRKIKKTPRTTAFNEPFDSVSQNRSNRTVRNICGMPQEDLHSQYGFNLNFATDTVSNVFVVKDAAASQKSVSMVSAISDFRFKAKRCHKNIIIGFNALEQTVSSMVCGSEKFDIAHDMNVTSYILDIKPMSECTYNSEMHDIIENKSVCGGGGGGGGGGGTLSVVGNMPTETQSLGTGCGLPSYTPQTVQARSMPEIPSRNTVVFPSDPVINIVPKPSDYKDAKSLTSKIRQNHDPIASALDAYRAEMKPLREALDKLKQEVRELNIPQLMPNYYNAYSAPPQQYPVTGMIYPGPSVRHTTAVSNGCGTRTETRMKPLFMQNMVGSQYNQVPYQNSQLPSGMPPMPYYLPSQQYPPIPYTVPGMVPYPPSSIHQQPSDLYSHHEYIPLNPPSCKSRKKKKKRNKVDSKSSKESQVSEPVSNQRPSCRTARNKNCCEEIETHCGARNLTDDSSDVSIKANCYVISNTYKIEIAADQAPVVEKEITTTDLNPVIQIASESRTKIVIQSTSSRHGNNP